MASQETTTTPKPFQFGLRSIFVATSAIAGVFGVLHWFSPAPLILAVQSAAVITLLVQSRGTAWPGMVIGAMFVGLHVVLWSDLQAPIAIVLFLASVGAWFGGGISASEATKKRYRFLRWSWLLASVWFLALVVIVMIDFELNPPNW